MRNSNRWLWLGAFALAACGGAADRSAEFDELVAQSKHGEVLTRTQAYLDKGEESAAIYFARGWAELRQDADLAAKEAFAECMLLDDSYAPRIAQSWREAALADAADTTRWYERGGLRMTQAFLHDRSIALEPLVDNVANVLFKVERRYNDALTVYRQLRQKTTANFSKRQEWEFRYGRCFQLIGELDSALAIYDGYLKVFPKDGGFDRYAAYAWMDLHREQAAAALAQNDLEGALRWIEAAPRDDYAIELQQEIRLLAGSIREARGEHREALAQYEAILKDENRSGGEVVQSAKDRIDEIRAQGIR